MNVTGPSVLEYQAAQSTKNSWEYPSTRLKNYRQNKMEQQPPPHEINDDRKLRESQSVPFAHP